MRNGTPLVLHSTRLRQPLSAARVLSPTSNPFPPTTPGEAEAGCRGGDQRYNPPPPSPLPPPPPFYSSTSSSAPSPIPQLLLSTPPPPPHTRASLPISPWTHGLVVCYQVCFICFLLYNVLFFTSHILNFLQVYYRLFSV
ncbi:unnamed protein product [Boreogadus saida]